MPHTLIVGMTRSGKTTLARDLLKILKGRGFGIVVLETRKFASPNDWPVCDRFYTDPEEFNKAILRSRHCVCVCEEAGEYLHNHEKQWHWWGTSSRHLKHQFIFISQRAAQIAVTVRTQCDVVFVFRSNKDDVLTLSRDFDNDEILKSSRLDRGQYLKVPKFGEVEQGRVF